MNDKIAKLRRFLSREDGPTAIEYAMMLALMITILVAIIANLGAARSSTFSTVNNVFSSGS